jgi:hypothetical protein
MQVDEAKALLIDVFRTTPDLPEDMKAILARLIVPPVKRQWWRVW